MNRKAIPALLAASLMLLTSCGTAKKATVTTAKITGSSATTQVSETTAASSAAETTTTAATAAGTTAAAAQQTGAQQTTTAQTTATTVEETEKTNASKAVAAKTLKNTYSRLTKDKALNIGYIGGSVTCGVNASAETCWAGQTTTWFQKNFPNATIKGVNVGNGGTGTRWAANRIERDLFRDQKIDLLFVETAMNDAYLEESSINVMKYLETIYRKAYKANPNMDIIMVYITDRGHQENLCEQAKAQEQMAQLYGIHSINVGKALIEKMKAENIAWKTYFGSGEDYVHPVAAGYTVYANTIAAYLKDQLITNKPTAAISAQALPNQKFNGLYMNTTLLRAADIKLPAGWTTSSFGCRSLKAGASIKVEFTGTYCGLMINSASNAAKVITLKVDDKTSTMNMNSNMSEEANQHCELVQDNLPAGKHTFTVTNTSGGVCEIQGIFYGG